MVFAAACSPFCRMDVATNRFVSPTAIAALCALLLVVGKALDATARRLS